MLHGISSCMGIMHRGKPAAMEVTISIYNKEKRGVRYSCVWVFSISLYSSIGISVCGSLAEILMLYSTSL